MKQTTHKRKLTLAFSIRCCLTWLLALAMITQSAAIPAARAANPKTPPRSSSPKEPPATPPAPQSNVDLAVTALNTSAVVTDSQTLVTSGDLGVTIKNLGTDGVNAQFRVIAFEDRNGNGAFNQGVDLLLGSKQFIDGVPANTSASLSISLSGTITFKSNLIYMWVDSENAVAETDEGNNIRHTGQNSNIIAPPGQLKPIVKWKKDTFAVLPDHKQVIMTPAIIDVNNDQTPDVVFVSYAGQDFHGGVLRAISGADGAELWTVTNPAHRLNGAANLAVGDIDNDGRPEIVATQGSGIILAFEHDGTFKWQSIISVGAGNWGSVALADLDHDGLPEIIFGATVLNSNGTLRWQGNQGQGSQVIGPLSCVADLDLDGTPEIVAGRTAYRADGTIYWNASISDGYPAVGNFDSDAFPEVVVVTGGKVYLLEHTGQIKWGPISVPGGGNTGAPTVADVDSDGQPEIGVAGASRYVVLETDGSVKWQAQTQDSSSNVTGSSVFDFEGDGSSEVIYGDELFLRIYRGTDGQELYRLPKSSCTAYELPVIADVDADGKAEIVAVANQTCGFGPQNGIYVIGGSDNNWVNTRRIWNQHTYHITNVNEDGTIPRNEQPNWLTPGLNNFRLNTFAPGEGNPTGAPDLTASFIRKNDAAYPASTELTARIGNGGGTPVPPAVKVSFYRGDPASGGTLIGTTQTTSALNPGQYEDVKVVWSKPPLGLHPITVVADDNGSGQGTVNESNENNNKANANIALGIGPFALVDDLVARFKDGTVDLKWSPIVGAASYNIYRRSGNGSAQLIKQAHPRANFSDAGQTGNLTNGTTYYYTVRWVNANGIESGDGTEISATPTTQANRTIRDVPPTILSTPPTHIVANQLHSYQPRALDPDANETQTWSLLAPLDGMTINAATGRVQWTPTFAHAGYQNVTVRVQDSRGRFATQTYRLFVEIPNQPPLANAGPDQTVMATQTANLNGAVLDDGLPFGGTLTSAWTKVSGPGMVTFSNPATPVTTATFSALGTYVLRLTASDSQLSGSDEVTINVVREFASRIYTLNADFDEGNYSNVEHRIPHQLQLRQSFSPAGQFNPYVKWKKESFLILPSSNQPLSPLAVIDLNGDGIPDILFSTTDDLNNWYRGGVLRAISGKDGVELWAVTDPAYRVNAFGSIAVGDIDNDGKPEIITVAEGSGYFDGYSLICFEHDGTFKWRTPRLEYINCGGASIADLDNDGKPEIIVGATVLNNDGTVRWQGNAGHGTQYWGSLSVVADLDLDGKLEVIAGKTAYRADGSVIWNAPIEDGFAGIGNFDSDPNPEIVVVANGNVYLLEHDGKIKWGPVAIPGGGFGGPPTIADVDGDGQPEIGVAGASNYVVFETDGSIKWKMPTQDQSSSSTGSSVFDFDGDGSAEIIYGDELKLRIYRGIDGQVLYELPKSSGTGFEIPVIADVDGDNHAEIIVNANQLLNLGEQHGIFVIGDSSGNWANTRRIWNQHSYHITNINEDDTIPRFEQPNWLIPGLNNFRLNTFVPGEGSATVPLTGTWTVVFDSKIINTEWGRIGWNSQVCGDGALTVTAASSTDNTNFSAAQNVARGADLTVPNGRYLRISVLFRRASTGESPILYDLSVGTDGYAPPAQTNTPPTVDAGADQLNAVPIPAKLKGSVCDDSLPTGTLAFTWSKVSGPGTVTFANANAIETTATFSAAGTYALRLTASDSQLSASDELTVTVEGTNRPPVITSTPPASTCSNRPYSYQVVATDPNAGDVLTYSLPTAPTGMTINASTGLIQWTPTQAQSGSNNVKVRVADLGNNQVEQTWTINVTAAPPNSAPAITSTAPTGAAVGVPYVYQATASDPDPCEVLAYNLDAAPAGMTINSTTGLIQWTPAASQQGSHNVTVRVRDFSGLSVAQSFTINVGARDNTPPVVSLTSPAIGATLNSDVPVIGSVSDANLQSWVLEYKVFGGNTWVQLATGATPVANATLGTFPATLLANNSYILRLRASDFNSQAEDFREVTVNSGDLKLGPFTLAYEDMKLPTVGVPISIRRFYDSRPAEPGDFGPGWTLGFSGVDIRTDANYNVFITLPNGRRVAFAFSPVKVGFFPVYQNRYVTAPGVYDTLENTDCDSLFGGPGAWLCDGFSTYDPQNYRLRTKEGLVYTISASGGIRKIEDRNGRFIEITPNGVTSSSGRNVVFIRNAQGRITQITDPANNMLKYDYDSLGRLVKFTDQLNLVTNYTYYGNGHYIQDVRTPGNCRPLKTEYGPDGQVTAKVDNAGNRTTYSYDQANRTETITNSLAQTTVYKYDARGNLIELRTPLGTAAYTYDSNGNNLSVTYPSGRKIERTYDNRGNTLSESESPKPGTTLTNVYTYTSLNQLAGLTRSSGANVVFEYDDKGILKRREHRDAENGVIQSDSFAYDNQGNMIAWTDGEGKVTQYTINSFDQIISQRDPSGVTTTFEYDANGNVSALIDGLGNRTEYEYNGFNLLARVKHAGQVISSATYNEQGKPLTSTDALGRTTTLGYDCMGNLVQVIDSAGKVTRYQVDSFANLKKVTNVLSRETTFSYDALNRQTERTGPDGKTLGTGYDADGYIQTLTTPNGATIQTEYDGIGRVAKVVRPEKTIEYSYADCCRQSQVEEKVGSTTLRTTFNYDGIGRLLKVTDSRDRAVSYTYNRRGQRLTMTTPDGVVTSYNYNNAGRVTEIRTGASWARYNYDIAGRRTRTLYSNGEVNP